MNGTIIVSAFFQASLLPTMTIEVRLQVLDCSRLSADGAADHELLHRTTI
jgi:hypothetical protein